MADDVNTGYAEAMLTVARAEGDSQAIEAELAQVAAAVGSSDELRALLADTSVPAARRQQVIEDLLEGQTSPVTLGMVSMLVAAGRGGELQNVVDLVSELGAQQRGKVVAEVRSAIALEGDQQQRLADALRASTGKDVEVKVVIDPSIMGGLVTQIDDEIIDGSVRSRLGQLREAF